MQVYFKWGKSIGHFAWISEHVLFFKCGSVLNRAFLWRQAIRIAEEVWTLRERAALLLYVYIACLVIFCCVYTAVMCSYILRLLDFVSWFFCVFGVTTRMCNFMLSNHVCVRACFLSSKGIRLSVRQSRNRTCSVSTQYCSLLWRKFLSKMFTDSTKERFSSLRGRISVTLWSVLINEETGKDDASR